VATHHWAWMGDNHFYDANQVVAWKAMCIMSTGSMRWLYLISGYFIAHFIWMPGIFNRYFILFPRIFYCAFHIDAFSMDIAFLASGYFIALSYGCLPFSIDISLCISYGCLVISLDVSFLAPRHFIVLSYECLALQ
jgi:hypothetical protein